jgi:hypothetical protein
MAPQIVDRAFPQAPVIFQGLSQLRRKLIEQVFGWMKTVGGLRKLAHRGGPLVDWIVTFTAAAYNLIRLRTLLARAA